MAAELTPMRVGVWNQMWPPFLAPGARRWAMRNIVEGRIASARFEAAVPAGVLFKREPPKMPPKAFNLDLRLEDVTFRTFGELPPISGASGHAVLAGSTFSVDLEKGAVRTPSGASVAVGAGAFAIDNVFNPKSEGVVDVQLAGSAASLGEIANSAPFFVLDRRGIVPSDLSGNADASVSVRVPLDIEEGTDPAAQVDWKVTVTGTDLASKRPIEGRLFSDADVTIAVTKDEVKVNGTAEIDGVAAAVSFAQPLTGSGAASSRRPAGGVTRARSRQRA